MTGNGPRVVPERRPGLVRIAGFAVLLAAVSWGLGAFAAWPWAASEPGTARLRISVKHVTGFAAALAVRSPEELAKLPRHMRPTDPERQTTGRRRDAGLVVTVDGGEALRRTYRPTGWRRDGPVYAYEEVVVTPGRHAVEVRLSETGAPDRAWTARREIDFREGRAPLVEYVPGAGWHPE